MSDGTNNRSVPTYDDGVEAGRDAWACGKPRSVSAWGTGYEKHEDFCCGFNVGWVEAENRQREVRGESPVPQGFLMRR